MSEVKEEEAGPGAIGRLAIDLGPLIVFFAANAWGGIFTGTLAFMVAIAAAILVSLVKYRRISPLLWFSGLMVLVLGGITLWLHNETFIKIKPTIYYLTVAALLIFGLMTGRNLLKMVLGTAYPGLSERGWQLVTRNWAIFFVAMAIANEIVWRTQTTEFWIGYKLWGAIPATFVFALANIPMLMRHGFNVEPAKEEVVTPPSE